MGKAAVQKWGSRQNNGGAAEAERLAEGEAILRDRNLGVPVSEMCTRYGISRATLYRRIDEAIAARLVPTVDAYREQQNALLDDLMAKWQQHVEAAEMMLVQAEQAESMAGIERAIGMRERALSAMLRIAERRARLMGTDAPVRVEATVTHTTPVDAAVEALVADIEQRATA